jgi:hypothetical protein
MVGVLLIEQREQSTGIGDVGISRHRGSGRGWLRDHQAPEP